jgi:drug/metabolite transporter (DMT)-like permease
MFFAVFCDGLGDISLSRGMRLADETAAPGVIGMISAVACSWYIWVAVGLFVAFLILYLVSLSWEDLSYVLPLTGAVYVIVTTFAFFFLHEPVSMLRWIGSGLVALGVVYVARS